MPIQDSHFLSGTGKLNTDAKRTDPMLPHLGAGAGQAIEDGWVLGRVLRDYLARDMKDHLTSLETAAQLYQDVRLPRAQKTQATSRIAGDTYEMQTADLHDLSFEDCLPIIAERTIERMKWVWEEDLNQRYDAIKNSLFKSDATVATHT